jgi:predicted nucleic acid-binding protein
MIPSIPGIVVMELIQDAKDSRQVRKVLKLIAPLSIAWPTPESCHRALADFLLYHHADGLGLLDALIAACATGIDATLCTFNEKHYRMIPGLQTEQPYRR